ncbi:MAG TPA: PEP-CTERM sorting domain-containing protein [Phycisphaerae bacterium]|nr:PEP-CTERM sorting domain-containing protein [Phycisphaerae bacterium]HNU45345.1 PEP-CTERM sorting domain-containing protein [Phycisphaerae bacterium]
MRDRHTVMTWVALVGVSVASVALAAVPGTVATFDVDEEAFIGSTTSTVQVHQLAGGNPDGHVLVRKDLEFGFDIGTENSSSPAFLGDYAAAGITGGGFDLNVFNTTFDEVHLRFRRHVAENGWYYNFGQVVPNANMWESYDAAFDPTWNDVTALANGWSQEAFSPSFADLMTSVGWIEARLINNDSAIAGVDNVRIVPEPGTLALLGIGLALAVRRR